MATSEPFREGGNKRNGNIAAEPPVPLILEQQHITTVEGIVPTIQNIVAIVNLDCRLDLRTIARNAEYNPKVGIVP
ncbi:hypothetical protein B0H14DRAFT_3870639 [Mycena olivaceomarginata]|nr:hypothetical protein B0H14DRAFT_3870639 [Mycena olivaceomarginata]